MSGAVNFVKQVATNVVDDVKLLPKQPGKGAVGLMSTYAGAASGGLLGGSVYRGTAKGATEGSGVVKGSMTSPAGQLTSETIGGEKKPPPATIAAEDPAVVAAESEKKKARAKRQAEIDILTDKPGRGGTVLTDQYKYNV